MGPIYVVFLALAAAMVSVHSMAQGCDTYLHSSPDDPYGYRVRGNRCEGVYIKDLSASLRVVSFTREFNTFTGKEPSLHLEWTNGLTGEIHLRASSLRPRLYYEMDSIQPSGTSSYEWETSLLTALRITRPELGIVGWTSQRIGGKDRQVYVPVTVKTSKSDKKSSYQVVIIPGVELRELYVSLSLLDKDGSRLAALRKEEPLKAGYYPAEEGIGITIPELKTPGLYLRSLVQSFKRVASRLRQCGSVMESKDSDNLRPLVAKQLSEAQAEATHNGGVISDSTFHHLTRLAQLIDIRDKTEIPPRRQRWPVAVLFGFTLLVASILLFVRVHETAIDLQVDLSEVELGFSSARPWTDSMQLSYLGVSGLDSVTGPPEVHTVPRSSLKLSVAEGRQAGQLTLAPIFLPAKSRVWLRSSGTRGTYTMSIQAKGLQFRADVIGHIIIAGLGADQTFRSPRGFLLNGGPRETELELSFLNKEQNPFVQHLPLESISMSSVEEFNDGDSMLARKVSSVNSGILYFESLGGRERKLRQGEALEIEPTKGVLERISAPDGKIVLEFHGMVHGIKTGDDGRTDLMPTCLDWLQARHGLSLMWGTAIYLLGLIMGLLRWAGARV